MSRALETRDTDVARAVRGLTAFSSTSLATAVGTVDPGQNHDDGGRHSD